jgi:NADH-ubiquinone oxidoreductase chain 1
MNILFNILEIVIVLIPILMTVAFVTVAERKVMASMQRRCGPNAVGLWGLLQPFADAVKLLVKEIIIPRQSNNLLFVMGPCITLIFALLGWAIIPFGEGLAIFDYELGVFYVLAVSSIGSYGILISGWAANSKYAFMGAIRSTAQLLSYELVFSSIILIILIFSGSFSLTYIVECQQAVWNIFPLFPIAILFFIAILAETNRPPFDLPEAESELVAGFMTEHGSSIFVFFFLGEYSALILMSTLMSIFFLGGHHSPDLHKLLFDCIIYSYYYLQSLIPIYYKSFNIIDNSILDFITYYSNINIQDLEFYDKDNELIYENIEIGKYLLSIGNNNISYNILSNENVNDNMFCVNNINIDFITQFSSKDTVLNSISILLDKVQGSYILGFKIIVVVFFYIWVRASFPRLRYDQLMSLCWKELLPLVFAYIIFIICLFFTFDMMPFGITF